MLGSQDVVQAILLVIVKCPSQKQCCLDITKLPKPSWDLVLFRGISLSSVGPRSGPVRRAGAGPGDVTANWEHSSSTGRAGPARTPAQGTDRLPCSVHCAVQCTLQCSVQCSVHCSVQCAVCTTEECWALLFTVVHGWRSAVLGPTRVTTCPQLYLHLTHTFLHQHCTNTTTTLQQHYHNPAPTLPQHCTNTAQTLQQHYHNPTTTLQQHYHNTLPTLPQHYPNTTPILHQHYTKTAPTLLQPFTNSIPKFHLHCSNKTPTLHQPYTNTAPTLLQHYPNTSPTL